MFNLDDQLGFNINRVALLFRRELIRCFRDYHLSPEQWQILAALWQKKSLSQSEIMKITLQDAPATSRIISKMAKNNLVKMEASAADRRTKIVGLTKKGDSLKKVLPEKLVGHFNHLLKEFPSGRRNELLKILKDLRTIFGDL
ncbi:MAG: MarR family transcriptional regulator [Spirochaetia bacterium]|nr:MarR family transcriptional regulator [Spirochaetia bacterium]